MGYCGRCGGWVGDPGDVGFYVLEDEEEPYNPKWEETLKELVTKGIKL